LKAKIKSKWMIDITQDGVIGLICLMNKLGFSSKGGGTRGYFRDLASIWITRIWLRKSLNLSDLLLRNQGRKDWKNQSFTTTDEGFLEKLRIRNLFRNRMDSVLYIREEGNQKRKKMGSSFFYYLGAVWDESLIHGFEWEKEVRNPLFD
jgi:hypothetical protein